MLTSMQFGVGEKITGNQSGASYIIESVDYDTPTEFADPDMYGNMFNENKQIETEGDDLLDFTERNPFGSF